jgi:hypothetical protein
LRLLKQEGTSFADPSFRSINSGFQALRNALPSSIPTDSKAIILRKAVSHIQQLEGLLRRAGIEPIPSGAEWGDSPDRERDVMMDEEAKRPNSDNGWDNSMDRSRSMVEDEEMDIKPRTD